MKPWMEVAKPHPDVIAGSFVQSDFAADISQVVNGTAPDEYRDPEAFYSRTYVTEGMKQLLVTVAQRLNGIGGDPVIELKTNFGGGKTHTLLAVYHLAKYEGRKCDLTGIPNVLKTAGVDDVPSAKVVVIDGNALAPNDPIRRDGLTIRTLWGNLAHQLLGVDEYNRVAQSDAAGTSPGKAILEAILREVGPCVILMDELVAYYRQFDTPERLAGGSFESNVSFAQALTEAVKNVPQALLLVSLPSSETETAGTFGRVALETLEKTFGRVNAIWRPVSADEGFEIVKRRLFGKIEDAEAVEETCQAFARYYHEKRDSLPAEIQEGGWIDKMRRCYPIHPEVFTRLYEDWSTLENFQKTRGVLQYMAIVVNRLWLDGTNDPMILPASIPLRDTAVANKSTQFLPNGWGPIIDREIDGVAAAPAASIDAVDPLLGKMSAAVRVARTIFLGSAASSAEQTVRGIDKKHIFLGCAQPGQELSFYGDALDKMRERLQYLFSQDDRYWYDTRPNLSRTMLEYKHRLSDKMVKDFLEQSVRGKWGAPSDIADVHVFADHREVPDDITNGIRVVVLPLDMAYSKATEKRTFEAVKVFLDMCGTRPRMRKNRLVFIAPDLTAIGRIDDMCRTLLAWREVRDAIGSGAINATQTDIAHVQQFVAQSDQLLKGMIVEVFKYLVIPVPAGEVEVDFDIRKMLVSQASTLGDAAQQELERGEYLVRRWNPAELKSMLDKLYFKDGVVEIPTRKLWQDMASYYIFPRLVSADVVCETMRAGVAGKAFGYARDKGDDGAYIGFAYDEDPGAIGISDRELIIKDVTALAYKEKTAAALAVRADTENVTTAGETGASEERNGQGDHSPISVNSLPTAAKRKFIGEVRIDASRSAERITEVVDEVIHHLAGKGAKVKVTISIEAQSTNPFLPALVRTVGENANSLQFHRADFS